MSRYLFSISVGPVQEFIAAARRTRDLWYGSRLLSELSKAAARTAFEQGQDVELVFPAPDDLKRDLQPDSSLNVANKLLFLAAVEKPGDLVSRIRASVRQRLKAEMDQAIRSAGHCELVIDQKTADRQIDGLLEFYAAWVACDNDADYSECRQKVESLLAARKGLRNFAQHQGSTKFKNTIDGIREDVIDPESRERAPGFQVKSSERLDAVGVLKRFGDRRLQPPFDSTRDLAAVPYARQLLRLAVENEPVAQSIDAFRRAAERSEKTVGSSFGRLGHAAPGLLSGPEKDKDAEKEPEDLTSARRELHDAIRAECQDRPALRALLRPKPPYYAMLMADGDRMGEALSNLKTVAGHRNLSQQLSNFAVQVQRELETKVEHLGSGLGTVIYAGGDDLLALLPLDTALIAMDEIHRLFQKTVTIERRLSLSAGLVIAHAQEDLTAVREMAKDALYFAKEKRGRNALAITLMRRSGVPFTCGGQWDEFLPLITELLAAYEDREVPFGLGYDWRTLARRCREAKLADELAAPMALAALEQKRAGDLLKKPVRNYVRKAADLDTLADTLVLARALYEGGARMARQPEEAMTR